jgi:hypothetical protein
MIVNVLHELGDCLDIAKRFLLDSNRPGLHNTPSVGFIALLGRYLRASFNIWKTLIIAQLNTTRPIPA